MVIPQRLKDCLLPFSFTKPWKEHTESGGQGGEGIAIVSIRVTELILATDRMVTA